MTRYEYLYEYLYADGWKTESLDEQTLCIQSNYTIPATAKQMATQTTHVLLVRSNGLLRHIWMLHHILAFGVNRINMCQSCFLLTMIRTQAYGDMLARIIIKSRSNKGVSTAFSCTYDDYYVITRVTRLPIVFSTYLPKFTSYLMNFCIVITISTVTWQQCNSPERHPSLYIAIIYFSKLISLPL